MNYTTHREHFFSSIPETDAQFGNLITLREKEGKNNPGINQGFLASLIQFQPLFELILRGQDGKIIEWDCIDEKTDPVESVKKYKAGGFSLVQKSIVNNNDVLVNFEIDSCDDCSTGATVEFSGASLFSPQGIPYHWDKERKISWKTDGEKEIYGEWENDVFFSLNFSEPLDDITLKMIDPDEIEKEQYFSSFNLKKRFTYWVPQEKRRNKTVLSEMEAQNTGYSAFWKPSFSAEGKAFISVKFSVAAEKKGKISSPSNFDYEKEKTSLSESWDCFIDNLPEFTCSDSALERIYYTSWFVLKSGKISLNEERLKYPFTSVNKFHYYNQFFWDSAFQAIAWLWYNEKGPAESEMKNYVSNQWRNGMIPYELFMFPINAREWMDGDGKTTGTTQPPVIGITIKEVFNRYRNRDYPEFFYNSLLKYENWLSLYRDLSKRGLSSYVNIWETGWDNSPRFDKAARNRVLDPYVEGVDFNVYIYILRKTILDIAKWLGKPEPDSVWNRMEQCKKSMNELMYSGEDGFYYDLEAGTSEKIPVKTAAGLLPLMTDIPSKEQKDKLVKDYLISEKEFFTGNPVPSVSRSEESYDPQDFWRGANWPQITWSVLYGIKDEYPDEAGDILDRFLEKTSSNSNCYEYYHSETGEGAGLPFQGWGALYTDFIIRFVGGLNPAENGFRFRPLSDRYTEFSIKKIKMCNNFLTVSRKKELWTFEWDGTGKMEFFGTVIFNAHFENDSINIRFDHPDIKNRISISGNIQWNGSVLRIG